MDSDALERRARELYQADPKDFIARRNELVAEARGHGDESAAEALKKLRRPTTAAWAVNLLRAHHAQQVDALVALGQEIRSAQRELRGDDLRRLAQERTRLLDELTNQAVTLSAEAGYELAGGLRQQIEQTLNAALSDPESAAKVCAATLSKPLEYSGFGVEGATLPVVPDTVPAKGERSEPASKPETVGEPDELTSRRAARHAARAAEAQHELERRTADAEAAQRELRSAEAREQELRQRRETLVSELDQIDDALEDQRDKLAQARRRLDRVKRKQNTAQQRLRELQK